MTPSHGFLCEKIAEYLKPRCWFFRPNNMGYGRKGIPDFICCYLGQFYAFEVKTGADRLTPWQSRELADIRGAGGIALEVRSVADVARLIP